MTSEIKSYIDQIRAKARQLHQQLVIERERSTSMDLEISRLKELLTQQESQLTSVKDELVAVTDQLAEQREQVQVQSTSRGDFEIDGLVKEIDFCIQQLKIANE
jgi:uncharacterized protein HemX